ncbi:MAG: hypothetical protein COA69_07940 [Robiginitomaculum sp.]|nr:MAG: hypothetical protein COA69_07940 [Robiginitomaculum sp.]
MTQDTEKPIKSISEATVAAYWKANISLMLKLLAVWAFVSYGCGILFRPFLDQFSIGGAPLGFWFAQQGAIYVFLVLVIIYIWRMSAIERAHGVSEDE